MPARIPVFVLLAFVLCRLCAQTPAKPQLILLDTDIGDDIDDAFALSLLLESPEAKILGITTAYGPTELRARLVDRFLASVGRSEIPVAAGVRTDQANLFSQRAYAERSPERTHPNGVSLMLDTIRAHPGEVTLIAIGPLNNVEAAIDRDAATFHKVKRVVLMGGSIYRGYGASTPPQVEWNTGRDPAGLRKLLAAGVPVFVLPLDSTQIPLERENRERIFALDTPVTDQLTLLYHQWADNDTGHPVTPTLYDPVAAAYALRPELCPMTPLHIEVDEKGMTKPVDGPPNAEVCLKSDEHEFLSFLLNRIAPAK